MIGKYKIGFTEPIREMTPQLWLLAVLRRSL